MELVYRSGVANALWASGVQPVYLFYGAEDRLKEEAVAALVAHVVEPDFADFDREALNAGSADAPAILAAAGQAPFGSERRLVVVHGLEAWRERGKTAEADRLAEGLARLSGAVCLALVVKAGEEEGRRKTIVTAKLDAAVRKLGMVVDCQALKGESLMAWVLDRVRREGKRIAPDAAQALVQTVGSEMR